MKLNPLYANNVVRMSWVWLALMNRYTAGVNQLTMLLSFMVIVSAHNLHQEKMRGPLGLRLGLGLGFMPYGPLIFSCLHPRVMFLWKLKFKRVLSNDPMD